MLSGGHSSHIASLESTERDRLASGGSFDHSIKIWQLNQDRDGNEPCVRTLTGHRDFVLALKHLGGDLLASGSKDRHVKVWNVASGECSATLRGHAWDVVDLERLANDNYNDDAVLASGSSDKSIPIWR